MANLVTLSRLLLLLLVAWLFYQPVTPWSFASFFLIIFIFVSDGLDGYIARKRNETSLFGALFDIAGDRITELTLWIVAADIDLVPIWVPLVFIIRGVIVDTIQVEQGRGGRHDPVRLDALAARQVHRRRQVRADSLRGRQSGGVCGSGAANSRSPPCCPSFGATSAGC